MALQGLFIGGQEGQKQLCHAGRPSWTGAIPNYLSMTHGLINFGIWPFQQWVPKEERTPSDVKLKLNLI